MRLPIRVFDFTLSRSGSTIWTRQWSRSSGGLRDRARSNFVLHLEDTVYAAVVQQDQTRMEASVSSSDYCNFCGKTEDKVDILVKSPLTHVTTFICNECVKLIAGQIKQRVRSDADDTP